MIFTSYFANYKFLEKTDLRQVSVARKTPAGMESYPDLFPSAGLLEAFKHGEIDTSVYEGAYRRETLSRLDPGKVVRDLKGSVLLCYERPESFCHRHIAAKWLMENGALCLELARDMRILLQGGPENEEERSLLKRLTESFPSPVNLWASSTLPPKDLFTEYEPDLVFNFGERKPGGEKDCPTLFYNRKTRKIELILQKEEI